MARPAVKRQAVDHVVAHHATTRRRAWRVGCQHRSVKYYRSRKDSKAALRLRMREPAQVRIRYGYRRLHVLQRRDGWSLGKGQTYPLYTEESLQLRSKQPAAARWQYLDANAKSRSHPTRYGRWTSSPTNSSMARGSAH
jgi:putative transposase